MDRSSAHRKNSFRKYRQRLSTLFVVVGILCLVLGSLIVLSALAQNEFEQGRFFRLGGYFLGGGTMALALYFFCFKLPDILHVRRSGVVNRRKAAAKAYHRPKPTPGTVLINRDQDGSILILVLVLLGILAGVSLEVIVSARSAMAESNAEMNMGTLRLAAIDAAHSAMQELANDEDLTVDHLGEPWSVNQEFKDPSGITRMIRMADAERTFDLNNINTQSTSERLPPSEVLANIFILCGEFRPGEKLNNLRDWVDADTEGPRETTFYQKKTPPYQTPGRILYGWEELFHVEGWYSTMFESKPYHRTGTLFEAELAQNITIIPAVRQRIIPVNINTATATTLQGILGIGREGVVEGILTRRKEQPYKSTNFLSDMLGKDEYQNISPYLDVKSHYFQINTSAFREGKSARVHILARRSDNGNVDAILASF